MKPTIRMPWKVVVAMVSEIIDRELERLIYSWQPLLPALRVRESEDGK